MTNKTQEKEQIQTKNHDRTPATASDLSGTGVTLDLVKPGDTGADIPGYTSEKTGLSETLNSRKSGTSNSYLVGKTVGAENFKG